MISVRKLPVASSQPGTSSAQIAKLIGVRVMDDFEVTSKNEAGSVFSTSARECGVRESGFVAIPGGRWHNGVDSSLFGSASPVAFPRSSDPSIHSGFSSTMKRCPICATSYPTDHRTCPTHGAILVETPELAPGTMIRDCYRIERLIGRGGMGTVYLAEHTLMEEWRALKFLSGNLATNPTFVQRFLQEARAATRLHHANIARTYELGQAEDGSFYISMEFVDGPSLRAVLEQAPRGLPPERAFNIVRGVAGALAEAHKMHMVHRDIKPENILLAWNPEREIAKVVDFGIVAMNDSAARITQTGKSLLTVEYAAPEQWRGVIPANELDGRTDLYSFGCMIYEMLTGTLPFYAETYDGWLEQHLYATPLAPSQIRPELAGFRGLDELILRMIAKDRDQRPATIGEFMECLESLLVRTDGVLPFEASFQATTVHDAGHGQELGSPEINRGRSTGQGASQPLIAGAMITEPGTRIPSAKLNGTRTSGAMPRWQRNLIVGAGVFLAAAISIIATVLISHYVETRDEQNDRGTDATRDAGSTTGQTGAQTAGKTNDSQQQSSVVLNPQISPSAAPKPENGTSGTNSASPNTPSKSTTASNTSRQAIALYNQGRYSEAAPFLNSACDDGNADSCTYLGWMYQYHLGVVQDYPRALNLDTRACNEGSMAGCNNLGYMYQAPVGVPQDLNRALNLFTEACDANLATSCDNLGKTYERALGVSQNYPQAATLYDKACTGGSMDGCKSLAFLYEYKLGVPQDYPRAISLYTRACDAGNAEACRNLGWMYENKMGVAQDLPHAVSLYATGCRGNYMPACNDLGYMYQHGSGVERSNPKALEAYTKGCNGDDASACNNLGVMYQDKLGVDQDLTRSASLYNKSCLGGNATGCASLGMLYRDGKGVDKDPAKARILLSKSCSMGNQTGCDNLKQMPQ